ncbi:hypothetical protein HZH68_011328 [Vespula germanica]|uniref:Uncharacterized protein n=1 Tax=Vespula germanica TaxID=30212 RepID=A0A834N031_VESGE|nr:hypothetical protein HZH68_011328 [Vespula germanica]
MDLVADSVQTCNVFSSDHTLPITLVLCHQYRAHIVPTTYNILTTSFYYSPKLHVACRKTQASGLATTSLASLLQCPMRRPVSIVVAVWWWWWCGGGSNDGSSGDGSGNGGDDGEGGGSDGDSIRFSIYNWL